MKWITPHVQISVSRKTRSIMPTQSIDRYVRDYVRFLSYHLIPRVLNLGTLHTKPLLNIFVTGLLIHEAVSLYFIGRSHHCFHELYILEMETIFLAMGRLILHLKGMNAIDVWFTCKFFQIICCDYVAPTTSNKLMRLFNVFPTSFRHSVEVKLLQQYYHLVKM